MTIKVTPIQDDAGEAASKKPLPVSPLYDVRQSAAYLNVSEITMWRHSKNGKLPQPVRIGSSVRWRKADLDAFINGGAE